MSPNPFISNNIKSEKELSRLISNLKKQGKTVGLCVGAYDLLHPGHVKHFESAKKMCDVLVVGVTSDTFVRLRKGPNRPIFNQNLRAYMVSQIKFVDYVFVSKHKRAVEPILKLKPNFYIKGPDYINKNTSGIKAERKAIESVGGTIKYTKDEKFSTSELIERIKKTSFDKPVLLVPFGLTGVGKSTILKEFCRKYKWVYLNKDSINEILLREYNKEGSIIKSHKMFDTFYNKFVKVQSYFLVFRLAYDNLRLGNNVVVDAYFSNKVNTKLLTNLNRIVRRVKHHTIKVLFDAPKGVVLERIKRRGLLRDLEKIKNFDKFFKEHSTHHKKTRFDIIIDTTQPVEINVDVLYTKIINTILLK